MSAFKGTPGPWLNMGGIVTTAPEFNAPQIAEAYKNADAVLIAQAPAMLEALLRFFDQVQPERSDEEDTAVEAANKLYNELLDILAALREGGAL